MSCSPSQVEIILFQRDMWQYLEMIWVVPCREGELLASRGQNQTSFSIGQPTNTKDYSDQSISKNNHALGLLKDRLEISRSRMKGLKALFKKNLILEGKIISLQQSRFHYSNKNITTVLPHDWLYWNFLRFYFSPGMCLLLQGILAIGCFLYPYHFVWMVNIGVCCVDIFYLDFQLLAIRVSPIFHNHE